MLNLNHHLDLIEEFIHISLNRFIAEHQAPLVIGVYCCPWAGWLTTNYCSTKTLAEADHNCLDFDYIAYDFLDLNGWKEEYNRTTPTYLIDGMAFPYDEELGDEGLNELVFNYLQPILVRLKMDMESTVFLQMVDSEFNKVF